jgi:sulfur carrier protein ThiS
MEIEVTLYSPLQDNRFSKATVNLVEPASIDTLLQHLTIEQHEVGSVYVNGKGSTFSHSLVTGDRVTLLPMIGGG